MIMTLCITGDVPNKIKKDYTQVNSFEIVLKEDTDIKYPVVIVNLENSGEITGKINYATISWPAGKRCYFVRRINVLENGNYELHLVQDLLTTYKNFLLNHTNCLVDRADVDNMNKLVSGDYPTNVNEKLVQYKAQNNIFSNNNVLAVLAVSGGVSDPASDNIIDTGVPQI